MELNLVEQIIGAIAVAEETEPQNLDICLQDCVDTDGIRQLAAHDGGSWELRFDVKNYDVNVKGDGTILIDGEENELPSDF